MKKASLIITMAIAAASLQACKGHSGGSGSDSSSNTKTDSTSVAKTDTSKSSSDTTDAVFAKKAAIGGMAEVALGKLALTKASSPKIKDFANMMITDHGKANNELMGIAKTENIMLPPGVDTKHQAKMDSLSNLSGMAFDKAYVAAMIEGHEKTLALMKTEASDGKDTSLKAFAAKTAPIVQMHLDAINKINAGMK
jgi:putative membrane protein